MKTFILDPLYQKALESYKFGALTHQPHINWSFEMLERGYDWDNNLITISNMQKLARSVNPVGPAVSENEVIDITPTFDEYKIICGEDNDYAEYEQWIESQVDAFFYGRANEDFYRWEGFRIAAKLGYKKIIFENYS